MTQTDRTYRGGTFAELIKQYHHDRITTDPQYKAAVEAAKGSNRK
jgi:hypothetical protein